MPSLKTMTGYTREHDDTDGLHGVYQELTVGVGVDGDAWLVVGAVSLRYRTYGGGGMSMRTRNALLVLAEAIRRDNEERPQG